MRKHTAKILKIVCAGLVALLAVRVLVVLQDQETLTALESPEISFPVNSDKNGTGEDSRKEPGGGSESKKEENSGATKNGSPSGNEKGDQDAGKQKKEEAKKAGPGDATQRRPHGPGKPTKSPPLPEKYKVIVESGVFGRPPPKKIPPPALLGIAGGYALLRAPDGKVDLVKEGGSLGGVKVLRIGINRVLIEYQEKQQELTIFAGMGGSSLLPPRKDKK